MKNQKTIYLTCKQAQYIYYFFLYFPVLKIIKKKKDTCFEFTHHL